MAEIDHESPPDLKDEAHGGGTGEPPDTTAELRPLKTDKNNLSSGDSWMEIRMGDTDGQDLEAYDPETGELKNQDLDSAREQTANNDGTSQAAEEKDLPNPPDFQEKEHDPNIRSEGARVVADREIAQGSEAASVTQQSPEMPLPSTTQSDPSISHQRIRSESRSTTNTTTTQRSTPVSSAVFVVTALDTIGSSKEARKNKELDDAVQKALANIKLAEQQGIDPEIIFRPLQLATKTYSISLQTTALDCIGKLITYSYFAFPSTQSGARPDGESTSEDPPLIERAIETICDCFENEATPIEIQQQIIKSLLAAVLNDKIVVHGAGLLKAVRQIYNIFIYSKSSTNQQVAQGSLTQMVGTVFERVRTRLAMKEARMNLSRMDRDGSTENQSDDVLPPEAEGLPVGHVESNGTVDAESPDTPSGVASDQPAAKEPGEKLTLQSFETSKNFDDAVVNDNVPTMVTRAKKDMRVARSVSGLQDDREEAENAAEDEEDEIYVRDAFLVFRSLCKLSHKVLPPEQQQDIKSQNMRSKLLSLHLIHNLLNNHMIVFTSPLAVIKNNAGNGDPTTFMQAAKPHLCLSLSRNGSSSIPRVFEVCCEIFWLMLKNLRVMLKKELEVFLKEIYLAILERRTAPSFQKQHFMEVLERLSADPRALVEIYLNYDCDRTALDNMYQIIIEQLSRISSTPVTVTVTQQQQYQEHHLRVPGSAAEWHQRGTLPPSLATANMTNNQQNPPAVPAEYIMKQQALECLVEILRSLDNWSSQGIADVAGIARDPGSRNSFEDSRESLDTGRGQSESSPRTMGGEFGTGQSTPVVEDDPSQLELAKQRKTALSNGIKQFNFKPKRGIKALIAEGFIPSDSPEDVASFLLANDRLDKAMIGEYLGEGDPQNIATMHAFVDSMNFTKRRFVDALRSFLQSFRLPGEAQKIDRFMLKFAERYLGGNPNAFANADTAYVLAYSVIMLNTDQHSMKIKAPRMTKEDFIKNNRGINDNHDLPDEYLIGIFDEISQNEIVLNTERENAIALGIAVQAPPGGLASRAGHVLATVGRDLQKEKYAQASEEMANKTEQLYRSLIRAQRKTAVKTALTRFIPATSFKHVGPMFNVTWMSFLSGLSGQVQDSQNLEIVKLCMEGLKLAIRLSCLFDLETPRVAFVTALAKFTNLGNLKEMMAKNIEALKVLLDVALTEGNLLKSSWREVLTCVSQLDRFQLLSGGVDESSIPDVSKARIVTPANADGSAPRRSTQAMRRPRPRSTNSATYQPDVAIESRSAEMIRGVDRIFTNTANLSTDAIIDFIRALSDVSWQEIQSSGNSDSPRTYSLQKLVEISYYNMTRVRIEWTKIWEVLGEHFVQVGCHTNTAVVYFALDSLRQLAMRFMEIEELPGFKFQKDFLKPFEHVMANSNVVAVKDMVLRCLIQMIQARGDNIRSGWRTMFGVFTVAAKEPYGECKAFIS
jgi:brefeldin A-inhibited guanine nucleotide-exchange protein